MGTMILFGVLCALFGVGMLFLIASQNLRKQAVSAENKVEARDMRIVFRLVLVVMTVLLAIVVWVATRWWPC